MAPNDQPEERFNKDELVPPSFLNEKYILDMLISMEKDPGLHLINFEIRPGSAAGDHYASIMFKIIVTYGTSKGETVVDRRLILKTMPEDGQKKELLSKLPVFENEISMYTKTLPAMEEILAQHGEKRFWPKCVFTSEDPPVIVFDDLTQDNYAVIYTPLTVDTIEIAVDHIANYHAMSMVLLESDQKELVNKYKGVFAEDSAIDMFTIMARNVKTLGVAVKTWKGFERIGESLLTMQERLTRKILDAYAKENTWGFNVLNHGDFHIRNLMFQKDEGGNLKKIMFLDFQMPMFRSPAIDLFYLLNMIGDDEVRDREGEVIKMYHQKLLVYLEKYGYTGKAPSVIDVLAELLHMTDFDAFQKLCIMPMFKIDMSKLDLGEFFNTDADSAMNQAVMTVYNEPKFVEAYKKLLYGLDMKGVFD